MPRTGLKPVVLWGIEFLRIKEQNLKSASGGICTGTMNFAPHTSYLNLQCPWEVKHTATEENTGKQKNVCAKAQKSEQN